MNQYEKCLPPTLNMNVTHATGPTEIKDEATANRISLAIVARCHGSQLTGSESDGVEGAKAEARTGKKKAALHLKSRMMLRGRQCRVEQSMRCRSEMELEVVGLIWYERDQDLREP
jgi:hypothetical protein